MSFHDGFVSEIVGRTAVVDDGTGRRTIGKVSDFLVGAPGDTFPRIDALVVKTGYGPRFAPISTVRDVNDKGMVVLSVAPDELATPPETTFYLIDDLFDKQIVDVDGRKLVRINDIEVARTGDSLRVVAADIGVSGLLRRIGANRIAPKLFDRIPRTLIAWDNVAPLNEVNPENVKLSVTQARLSRLHPSDLAEIVNELSAQDAARIIDSLDDETAADAFEHLAGERRQAIIKDLGTERAAGIIEEMDDDDAADLLGELPEDQRSELLAEMEPETAGELRDLVEYDEDSAGGLMTTDYVWIYPHRTVAATIDKIREIAPESEFIYYLYVLDQHREAARRPLAADAAAIVADRVHSQADGHRHRERSARHEQTGRRGDDRALRPARLPGPQRRREDARHRDGRRRDRRDHSGEAGELAPAFHPPPPRSSPGTGRDRIADVSPETTPTAAADRDETAARLARRRRTRILRSIMFVVGILGPGFITASAGNDVGGIATYSLAGAQFGYKILWTMVPITVALIVVQEMAGRMGVVTGKGLAALMRENFGVRITLITMTALFSTNMFTTSAEFAGIASASEIFGVSRYIAVPVAVFVVFLFVLRFDAKIVERTFVVLSLVYFTYIISGIQAHPDWGAVVHGMFVPTLDLHDPAYLGMVVALVGTTISPYMQFYLQAAVVEKGTRRD